MLLLLQLWLAAVNSPLDRTWTLMKLSVDQLR